MKLPKVAYTPEGGAPTELQFEEGPQNFECFWETRVNRNLATANVVEHVFENNDLIITFEMQYLKVDRDLPYWASFMLHALPGNQFKFYPDGDAAEFYNLVSEDEGFVPRRNKFKRYSAAFRWRVVEDAQAPTGPDQVLKRFYGIAP